MSECVGEDKRPADLLAVARITQRAKNGRDPRRFSPAPHNDDIVCNFLTVDAAAVPDGRAAQPAARMHARALAGPACGCGARTTHGRHADVPARRAAKRAQTENVCVCVCDGGDARRDVSLASSLRPVFFHTTQKNNTAPKHTRAAHRTAR